MASRDRSLASARAELLGRLIGGRGLLLRGIESEARVEDETTARAQPVPAVLFRRGDPVHPHRCQWAAGPLGATVLSAGSALAKVRSPALTIGMLADMAMVDEKMDEANAALDPRHLMPQAAQEIDARQNHEAHQQEFH